MASGLRGERGRNGALATSVKLYQVQHARRAFRLGLCRRWLMARSGEELMLMSVGVMAREGPRGELTYAPPRRKNGGATWRRRSVGCDGVGVFRSSA